jgi:hypothetical protein
MQTHKFVGLDVHSDTLIAVAEGERTGDGTRSADMAHPRHVRGSLPLHRGRTRWCASPMCISIVSFSTAGIFVFMRWEIIHPPSHPY